MTDVARATAVLREHGVLSDAALHTSRRLAALLHSVHPGEALALALAVRAPEQGHVALDLDALDDLLGRQELQDLTETHMGELRRVLEDVATHVRATSHSPLIRTPGSDDRRTPLVRDGSLLYLDRWYGLEVRVAVALRARFGAIQDPETPTPPDPAIEASIDEVFDVTHVGQRAAARASVTRSGTVVAGGPGTGKTWTAARVLAVHALLATDDDLPVVALAAPTGKAAARLAEGVDEALQGGDLPPEVAERVAGMTDSGTTLHRLLGLRPGRGPWYGADRPLPHDLVLVDEASMIPLPLMAQLLDALRPDATLVLLGDPDQLASVEAGTVLGDVVRTLTDRGHPATIVLQTVHRFGDRSGIADLANAIRDGDTAAALQVLTTADDLSMLRPDESGLATIRTVAVERGRALLDAGRRGDLTAAVDALASATILTAHNRGPFGVARLNADIESSLSTHLPGWRTWDRHQVGRPVLVTANDRMLGVHNGDLGVHVLLDGATRVAFDIPVDDERLTVHPDRLPAHEAVHAMTIHKSQGSQWDHVVVVLPPFGSPLLTRELLYTAVTRARQRVTVVGERDVLAHAVTTRIRRASRLGPRLATLIDG